MLKLATITSILLALLGSCNEERLAMSADAQEPKADDATPEEPKEPEKQPPPVTTQENPAPKQWPKCWRSARLSTMTAFRLAGFGGEEQAKPKPRFQSSDGRQELTGESKNPTTTGKWSSTGSDKITAKNRGS